MVQTFAIAGTPDRVREQIEAYWGVADALTLIPPIAGLRPQASAAYQRAIADTLFESERA